MRYIGALILFFSLQNSLTGQVFPPDLLCMRGDTIVWDLPSNNCGTFNSYQIYFSSQYNGPYTLLTAVTNPAQTTFVHPNPGNQVFYYYMTGNYNCPGQPVLSSDTLDNLLPEPPVMQSVSVDGDNVQLVWSPSPSPEVYAYMIYRLIGANVDVIDTVFSGNTYLDTDASPGQRSEEYYVLGLDQCGNTSLFQSPHKTILLNARVDSCNQSVLLDWNPYENWANGIGRQVVWLSRDGGPFVPADTLGAGDDEYSYLVAEADEGLEHCFFLQAVENGTGNTSNSNRICVFPWVVSPMENLAIKNATFTPAGPVRVDWVWKETAEISNAAIWRTSGDPANMSLLANIPFTLPLNPAETFEDPGSPQNQGPLYYEIRTVDQCGLEARSTLGATIFLEGQTGNGFSNQLSWTPWQLENSLVLEYELYRVVNGIPQFEAALDPGVTTYTDEVDPENTDEARVCYYLLARGGVYLPNDVNPPVVSRSNTICLDQHPIVRMPNAFAPNGVNQEFRPAIQYPNAIRSYQLQIFNRYGQLVFETSNWSEGWDGKYQGQQMPQGSYVYRVQMVFGDSGEGFEKEGVLVLLR
jgi:gliding motility-associated-like protein